MKYFLLSFVLVALIFSCDQQFEYEVVSEPTIDIRFLNNDSISQLDALLFTFDFQADSLSDQLIFLDSTLSALEDSITSIQLAIDTGNLSLQPIFESLILEKQQDSLSRAMTVVQFSEVNIVIDSLTESLESVSQGFIRIDYVSYLHSGFVDDAYTDSLSLYTFPLNISDTISDYVISFGGNDYTLTLRHQNIEKLNADLEVFISIESISEVSSGFDSLSFDCHNTLCDAYSTEITCYY